MQFDEFNEAIEDAERTMYLADVLAAKLARILVGRLRKVKGWGDRYYVAALKKELRDFNSTTRTWKEEQ